MANYTIQPDIDDILRSANDEDARARLGVLSVSEISSLSSALLSETEFQGLSSTLLTVSAFQGLSSTLISESEYASLSASIVNFQTINNVMSSATGSQKMTFRGSINGLNAINIKDYGAVGDGVTDDRAAIQSAISALEASTSINTLHFPRGIYRLSSSVSDINTMSSQRCLILGTSELSGRDIKITGDPGATLRQTLSTQRTQLLIVLARFRSLDIDGIKFEKDETPLAATASEPVGNDAISLIRVDDRKVEEVKITNCVFYNMHGALFTYNWNYDVRFLLRRLVFSNNYVINPWGSNTINGASSFGGGQQLRTNPWCDTVIVTDNYFEGASEDLTVDANAPGGKVKDAAYFGDCRNLIFRGNTVIRMGVETVYHTGLNNFLGVTSSGFTVPVGDNLTEATVTLSPSSHSSGPPANIPVGSQINIQVDPIQPYEFGAYEVTAYNPTTRTITFKNANPTGNLSAGSVVTASKYVHMNVANPGMAVIEGNTFDNTPPIGAWANTAPYGIVFTCRSTIQNNIMRGNYVGIYSYALLQTPAVNLSQGTIIQGNYIVTLDSSRWTTEAIYGINLNSDGCQIIGNTSVAPSGSRFYGINLHGDNHYVAGNQSYAITNSVNGYSSANRAIGFSVGNTSTGVIFEGNHSRGLDVGIGPATASQNIPMTIRSHNSVGDVLAIDLQPNVILPKTGYQTSPQFSAYLTANQSHTSAAFEKLSCGTEEFDIGSCYEPSNGRFTPNVKGRYQFTAAAFMNTIGSGATVQLVIRKNNVAVKTLHSTILNSTAAAHQLQGTCIIEANGSSDYFEAWVYKSSASAIDMLGASPASSYFQATLLP